MGTAATEPDLVEAIEFALERTEQQLPSIDTHMMRLVLLLHRVDNLVTYDLESTVHRPRGLSWPAFQLLFVLWSGGEVESKVAAVRSGMSRAAVSSLSNTLENTGLIQRNAVASDKRRILLSLTPEGRSTLQDALEANSAQEQKWAESLSRTEIDQLIQLLSKVAKLAQSDWVNRRD
jgi:DNA-binding MarR family transcriptional regulator